MRDISLNLQIFSLLPPCRFAIPSREIFIQKNAVKRSQISKSVILVLKQPDNAFTLISAGSTSRAHRPSGRIRKLVKENEIALEN